MTDKDSSMALSVDEEKNEPTDYITLSTGVVLHVTPVSSLIFSELQKRNKMPRPPVVYIKENDRKEENPNDPEYIQAKAEWETNMANAMIDVMVLRGTEIHSVPDGFPKVDDVDWSDDLALTGLDVPTAPRARYLAYIKYVVAAKPDDLGSIMNGVSRLSGVSETDVAAATDQFRDKK